MSAKSLGSRIMKTMMSDLWISRRGLAYNADLYGM